MGFTMAFVRLNAVLASCAANSEGVMTADAFHLNQPQSHRSRILSRAPLSMARRFPSDSPKGRENIRTPWSVATTGRSVFLSSRGIGPVPRPGSQSRSASGIPSPLVNDTASTPKSERVSERLR